MVNGTDLPKNGHTGQIFVQGTGINPDRRSLRLMQADEIRHLRTSNWHAEDFKGAAYFEDGYQRIQVWNGAGQIKTGVTCEYITGKPGLVYWGYTIVNEEAVYNPATSKNFDLVSSEQPDLVIKILKLAGVSIEDPQLAGIAAQEEQLNLQQENK